MIHEDQSATAISKDEHGIIHIVANSSITAAQAEANVQIIVGLSGGEPALLLVDLRNTQINFEVQNVYQMATNKERIRAMALLASSLNAHVAGEIFLQLGRFTLPVHIFDERDEAIAWLLAFDKE